MNSQHYNIAIIGLGAMGSPALYQLSKQGLNVIGIDKYAPPHGRLHPGYVDDELRSMTSLADERARDLKLTTDADFKAWGEDNDIEIVRYAGMRS